MDHWYLPWFPGSLKNTCGFIGILTNKGAIKHSDSTSLIEMTCMWKLFRKMCKQDTVQAFSPCTTMKMYVHVSYWTGTTSCGNSWVTCAVSSWWWRRNRIKILFNFHSLLSIREWSFSNFGLLSDNIFWIACQQALLSMENTMKQ